MVWDIILTVLLVLSVIANAYLVTIHYKEYKKARKQQESNNE
jgi:hypothetical protein